jgi:hypothetical protein
VCCEASAATLSGGDAFADGQQSWPIGAGACRAHVGSLRCDEGSSGSSGAVWANGPSAGWRRRRRSRCSSNEPRLAHRDRSGAGTPSWRQIPSAVAGLISRWRGTVVRWLVARFSQSSCLAAWRASYSRAPPGGVRARASSHGDLDRLDERPSGLGDGPAPLAAVLEHERDRVADHLPRLLEPLDFARSITFC